MSQTFGMPGGGGESPGANTYSIRFGGVVPPGMKRWQHARRGSVTIVDGRIVLTVTGPREEGGIAGYLLGVTWGWVGSVLSFLLRLREREHLRIDPAQRHAAHDPIRQRWSLELTDGKWMTFRLHQAHMYDNERFASKLKELYRSRLSTMPLARLTRMETAMVLLSLACIGWLVLVIVLCV